LTGLVACLVPLEADVDNIGVIILITARANALPTGKWRDRSVKDKSALIPSAS
jgi:hypothetical protein